MTKNYQPLEKINSWIKNSATLKLITITILMLLLLIPVSMIELIIGERENLNLQTVWEVSEKWAGTQEITGPILIIPLYYEHIVKEQYKEKGEYLERERLVKEKKYLHILPDELDVIGQVAPESLHRGIYEVVVYNSTLDFSGSFDITEEVDHQHLKKIAYDEAFLSMGISDLRGIKDKLTIAWNDSTTEANPGTRTAILQSGIHASLPTITSVDQPYSFNFSMHLQGSQNIAFIPLGKSTNVSLSSDWPAPSFNGSFLPDTREVSDNGFSAHWKVLQLNRNFPQFWTDGIKFNDLAAASFGVDLILPLDDYQKSMRSAKYGMMTIALTFLIFFLVEISQKRKIHPFQYTLVGLSLCLFYILLVSISEHTSFNLAYLLSALSVVMMISLYTLNVLKRRKIVAVLTAILIALYGFLFTILQLTDYALLMGSLGLGVLLSLTMYFTRNINWYNLNMTSDQ